jgi:hypothetical protein
MSILPQRPTSFQGHFCVESIIVIVRAKSRAQCARQLAPDSEYSNRKNRRKSRCLSRISQMFMLFLFI